MTDSASHALPHRRLRPALVKTAIAASVVALALLAGAGGTGLGDESSESDASVDGIIDGR